MRRPDVAAAVFAVHRDPGLLVRRSLGSRRPSFMATPSFPISVSGQRVVAIDWGDLTGFGPVEADVAVCTHEYQRTADLLLMRCRLRTPQRGLSIAARSTLPASARSHKWDSEWPGPPLPARPRKHAPPPMPTSRGGPAEPGRHSRVRVWCDEIQSVSTLGRWAAILTSTPSRSPWRLMPPRARPTWRWPSCAPTASRRRSPTRSRAERFPSTASLVCVAIRPPAPMTHDASSTTTPR